MPRTSDRLARQEARRVFEDHYAVSGDYRGAARAAGVSERTGRRWYAAEPTKLAPEVTSFVGRDAELCALTDRFADGTRLVTLLGAPGMGKTRLASRMLRSELDDGRQGYFCDLRSATQPEDLCTVVARVLDTRLAEDAVASRLTEALGRVLRARGESLLVLDNFEQLAPAAAETVSHWLRDAPRLRVLVTSRRVLRLEAEHVQELGPLELPASAEDAECESMRLFAQRAQGTEPALTRETWCGEDVVALVQRLEGIPLALELAAGQMRRIGPGALLRELDEALLDLGSRKRDIDPRHRTLRAAIDGSWQLLTLREQAALRQLTVFRGGFTLEAAESVIDFGEGEEAPRIADVVTSLRETSFLRVVVERGDKTRRWDLFEAIREFGERQLEESGEADGARTRHACHFLRWGEEWNARLSTDLGMQARAVLAVELDNLRTAWALRSSSASDASDTDSFEPIARMALVLSAALGPCAPTLALEALSQTIQETTGLMQVRTATHARLRLTRATLYRDTGNYAQAATDLEAARSTTTNSRLVAEIDHEEGMLHFWRGELQGARDKLERALLAAEESGELHLQARSHASLAWVLAEGFRDPIAFDHHSRAVDLFNQTGDLYHESVARQYWAVHRVFFERGDAVDELERQRRRADRVNDGAGLVAASVALGHYHLDRGDLTEARGRFLDAREVAARAGLARYEAAAQISVAWVLDEAGEHPAALEAYERASRCATAAGEQRLAGLTRIFLAGLVARSANSDRAAALLDEAIEILVSVGDNHYQKLAGLQRAQVLLALSRQALNQGRVSSAAAHRNDARALAERARAPQKAASGVVELPLTRCSTEARLMLRLIDRELALACDSESDTDGLFVQSDGSAFKIGKGPTVRFDRSPVLRRVLRSLAKRRTDAPGEPLTTYALLEQGWPDQKIQPEAGSRRVREIILRLRRAGLKDLLLTSGEGYFLDPRVSLSMPSADTDRSS